MLIRNRALLALLSLALASSWSPRSGAQQAESATLHVDGLSFYWVGGVESGAPIQGATVSIQLSEITPGIWSVALDPTGVAFPNVPDPRGRPVSWSLAETASGTLTVSGGTASISLETTLRAQPTGLDRSFTYPLTFTTGTATASASRRTASRAGVPLDLATGYVQLVAAGTDPPRSKLGVPFYTVLSGTIDLPARLSLQP